MRTLQAWLYEIQDGLATSVRRQEALEALRGLAPDVESPQGIGRELRLAQTHGLTAYDAAYLAVALNTGAILASNDDALRRAAVSVGVQVFIAPTD